MLAIIELIAQGKFDEALARIEGQFGPDPQGDVLYAKAIALAKAGRLPESRRSLKALIDSGNAHPDALGLYEELAHACGASASQAAAPAPFYGPTLLNPSTLAEIAMGRGAWDEILAFHGELATDDYVRYVDGFYRQCLAKFGSHWRYLDIVNVLYAASKTGRPRSYLEIGVRRGRSAYTVARGCPSVDIYAFDMWMPGYAGMENPGPSFVRRELARSGHAGRLEFIDGNSHETVPAFFRSRPELRLDLITVDGDHSEEGAAADLAEVIPRLAPGGILVMDDIAHPAHPYLLKVWREALSRHPGLAGFEYTEQGYGVAFAIQKT
jgi:predicted O-methyltransferase YrrM